jgi:hypothetical protein
MERRDGAQEERSARAAASGGQATDDRTRSLEAEWEKELSTFLDAAARSDVISQSDLSWRANALAE